MNYGIQPRDLDDLTPTELGVFLSHLDALSRQNG